MNINVIPVINKKSSAMEQNLAKIDFHLTFDIIIKNVINDLEFEDLIHLMDVNTFLSKCVKYNIKYLNFGVAIEHLNKCQNKYYLLATLLLKVGKMRVLSCNADTYWPLISHMNKRDIEIVLKIAIGGGHTKVLELLLKDNRVDPSYDNNCLIQEACHNYAFGYELVEILLKDPRVDPTDDGNLAIEYASENDDYELVKLLLGDIRINNADSINIAIRTAIKHGNHKTLRILLNNDKVDPVGYSVLSAIKCAVKNGYSKIIKMLINDKRFDTIWFNVDHHPLYNLFHKILEIYPYGKILEIASRNNYHKIIKILLDDGRFHPAPGGCYYAMHLACTHRNIECIKLFFNDPRTNFLECKMSAPPEDYKMVNKYVLKYLNNLL